MTIESSKNRENMERPVSGSVQQLDLSQEFSLRPKKLDEYIGQYQMKEHLKVAIESAKIRKSPLEHILFY